MKDHTIELTRRKILAATGAVGAAGAGAGVGTSALFTDEESFNGNSITAGTLDMTVDAKIPTGAINDEWAGAVGFSEYNPDTADGQPGVGVTLDDMKPGDWVLLCYEIEVQDNPACLGLKTENTANDENSVTEPEASREDAINSTLNNSNTAVTDSITDPDGEGELAQNLDVTVYDDFDGSDPGGDLSAAKSALSNELLGGVTLQDVWDTFDTGDAIADETNSFDFYVLLELPFETGNEVQSDSIKWDFVFDAVQSRNTDNDPYGNACDPVWGEGGECPDCSFDTSLDVDGFTNLLSVGPDIGSGFPDIDARVRVDSSLGNGGDLTTDDFAICEDGCGQTIDSLAFESGGKTDIVFVFDDTASMDDEVEALKTGLEDLIDDIAGAGINARYALVSFKDATELDQDFTGTKSTIQGAVDDLSVSGGNDREEDNLDALAVGTGNAVADDGAGSSLSSFRSGAQRIVIDITDATGTPEDSGGFNANVRFSQSDIESFLNDGNFTYFAVTPNDPLGDGVSKIDIAANVDDGTHIVLNTSGTGGTNFDTIINTITGTITQDAYVLSYTTTNPAADGSARTVDVEIDDSNKGTAYEEGGYTAPSS